MNMLIEACDALIKEINEEIKWATHPQNLEPENEASILYNLKKHRRAAKRYQSAVKRRHAVAIFGQSQVGKSYLVSNLAKMPDETKVEVNVPTNARQWVDFIEEINPPGGKESTGAVTRFTIVNDHRQGLMPFLIRLFSQSEVVKVIAHGYLSNITNYAYKVEATDLQEKLQQIRSLKQASPQAGFTEDDAHELQDYVLAQFPDHFLVKDLTRLGYWADLAQIVPFLTWQDRVKILHVLWGEHEFFDDVFLQLSKGLAGIDFLTEVRVEESALLPKGYSSSEKGWVTDTIIDVQMVMQMYDTSLTRKTVSVCGVDNVPKPIDKNVLTALVSEIVLVIPEKVAQHPDRKFFEHADVLDFPGAKSYKDMSEATFVSNTPHEKIEIFLRGKVAYLFEKYTYEFQINTLAYCLHNDPPEVKQVPHLLARWLHNTHGKNADQRQERERALRKLTGHENVNPLLWIMTKFNIEIDGKPNEIVGKPDTHDAKWSARLNANFVEYYNNPILDKWARSWDGDSFKNVFWLRDPKFPGKVYRKNSEGKEEINPLEEARMTDMHHSFTTNAHAKKYMHNPDEAWQETVPAGKSGIDYIVKYLTPTCDKRIKNLQLSEAITQLKTDASAELAHFYDTNDPAARVEKAREHSAELQWIFNDMQNEAGRFFGIFLDKIFIENRTAYEIYYNLMADPAHKRADSLPEDAISSTEKYKISNTLKTKLESLNIIVADNDNETTIIQKLEARFNLKVEAVLKLLEKRKVDISELFSKRPAEEHQDIAEIYAQKIIAKWLEHLRSIDKSNFEAWGIDNEAFRILIDEFDNTRKRVNLKMRLAEEVKIPISQFAPTNENYNLVASLTTSKLNNFVATVGFSEIPATERPKRINGSSVFDYPNLRAPKKDEIKIDKKNTPRPDKYIFDDFLLSLDGAIVANAMQNVTTKNIEQNRILGEILERIRKVEIG